MLQMNPRLFVFVLFFLISQTEFAIGRLPEIVFYGKVVDQHNQPVVGASVWISGENAYLSAGGGKGFVYTDEEGYFVVNTTGAALVLGSIRHPEIDKVVYYKVPDWHEPSGIEYKNTVRLLSHERKRASLNYNDYNGKGKAYEIRVWRMGQYEGAVRGYASFHIPSNGAKSSFRFDATDNTLLLLDDTSKAQFDISCNRSNMEHYQDFSDWSINITSVNGGIIETDDPYLNLAPVNGYESSLQIDMHKDTRDFRQRLFKRYYFEIENQQIYGSFTAALEPFSGPDEQLCIIRLNYKINPTGLRGLELKLNNIR